MSGWRAGGVETELELQWIKMARADRAGIKFVDGVHGTACRLAPSSSLDVIGRLCGNARNIHLLRRLEIALWLFMDVELRTSTSCPRIVRLQTARQALDASDIKPPPPVRPSPQTIDLPCDLFPTIPSISQKDRDEHNESALKDH